MNEHLMNCALGAISGVCAGVATWSFAVGVSVFTGLLAVMETIRLSRGESK